MQLRGCRFTWTHAFCMSPFHPCGVRKMDKTGQGGGADEREERKARMPCSPAQQPLSPPAPIFRVVTLGLFRKNPAKVATSSSLTFPQKGTRCGTVCPGPSRQHDNAAKNSIFPTQISLSLSLSLVFSDRLFSLFPCISPPPVHSLSLNGFVMADSSRPLKYVNARVRAY